jgi:hypothetical protein
MANRYDDFVVTIDSHQLNNAISKCHLINDELSTLFKNYKHRDKLIVFSQKTFYFKIIDKDTLNGIQICISPKTMKLEIYVIKNNKKNIENINTKNIITNANDIFNYFVKMIHYKYTMDEHINNVYDLMSKNYTNFIVSRKTNIIDILDYNSNNGYYIYFNAHSFANIGIINKGEYFNVNSISVLNMDELNNTILKMIQSEYHNVNYYNIIDTKYLDCDMSDYVNCNSVNDQSFDSNSQCDETDPV